MNNNAYGAEFEGKQNGAGNGNGNGNGGKTNKKNQKQQQQQQQQKKREIVLRDPVTKKRLSSKSSLMLQPPFFSDREPVGVEGRIVTIKKSLKK